MESVMIINPDGSEQSITLSDVGELAIELNNADETATIYLAKTEAIELRYALDRFIANM